MAADFGPEAKLRPRAVVVQLNPTSGAVMECALRYDVELPSGAVITDQEHVWHEATPLQRAQALLVARKCLRAIAGCRQLRFAPEAMVDG